MTSRIQWHGLFMWRTSTWHGEDAKEFRSGSSSWFCSDLSEAREQETLWLDDMFLLMIIQSTKLASGSEFSA